MSIRRSLVIAILSGLSVSGCQRGSAPAAITDADRTVIRAAVDDFTKAALAGDWATASSHYAEDGIILPPNAPTVEGRAQIQKFFAALPKLTAFAQQVVEIEGNGDLAYARGTGELAMMPPGAKAAVNDTLKLLTVWRKQSDGSWQVTRGLWNSNLPLPK